MRLPARPSAKERAFALRGLAQTGDPLALELFDFQARALGLHIANLAMALDPTFVVIGGGLMDPTATTPAFRERYLQTMRDAARRTCGRRSGNSSGSLPPHWANYRRRLVRRWWRYTSTRNSPSAI